MQYLLDTVVLVRHFVGRGKIGVRASRILDGIEKSHDQLMISVISLMEVMYLSERNRIEISLRETLDHIESSSKYTVVDLNADVLRVAETISFYELHDRLILATGKWLQIPVISSDREFGQIEGIEVVWE
jgi:predicted nucleic acid-binding protein